MNEKPLTKDRVAEIREKFENNFPKKGIAYTAEGWVEYKIDENREKTEKYVNELCQYLAYVKGCRYWKLQNNDQ